jgi:hypothetical protein
MVQVTTYDGQLHVRLDGRDALMAVKRRLDVPLTAVHDVWTTDDLSPWLRWPGNELGLRLPGTMLPGAVAAGSYRRRGGGWTFCCVRRGQRALVVDLVPGATHYRRLVLGVEGADEARAVIESAR